MKNKDIITAPLNLYDLTDLFHCFYQYHNEDCLVDYTHYSAQGGSAVTSNQSLSRLGAFRRIKASYLGAKPYFGGEGITATKPNKSLGYMNHMLRYLSLPYKAVLANKDYAKIRVDRTLHELENLSKKELEVFRQDRVNNPTFFSHAEISDDTTDSFNTLLDTDKGYNKVHEQIPFHLPTYGMGAILHNDIDFRTRPVDPIDLITEPQADWDPKTWSAFFVIKKLSANKCKELVRTEAPGWDKEALEWALLSSKNEKGILTGKHYSGDIDGDSVPCGENFQVKSFYSQKGIRESNVNGYYGNMLVVEGYYLDNDGKVKHVIFFPSTDCRGVDLDERESRRSATPKELQEKGIHIDGANVLYYRETSFKNLKRAITVIPFDRSEPSLELQRAYGHELFSPIEVIMRIDSSLLMAADLMSTPFWTDQNEGNDAADMEDFDMGLDGEPVYLGTRRFAENPFQLDLNGLITLRNIFAQHMVSKAFLGGLDGMETPGANGSDKLANLRLMRDARIHKHDVEDFADGLKEAYSKSLMMVLKEIQDEKTISDRLVKYEFFKKLTVVHGHESDYFEFDKKDIIEDTNLPYWLTVEAIRNGASHFGPAETIVFREIKELFGDTLGQEQLQSLNRAGIKSLIGSEQSLDILGDPKQQTSTDSDQLYDANNEESLIKASLNNHTLSFDPIGVKPLKHNHMLHLSQVHIPKAQETLQKIQEGNTESERLDEATIDTLETKNNLILQLIAQNAHITLHVQQLEKFGKKRRDVNSIREAANEIRQSAEGLQRSLEQNMRAIIQKRRQQADQLAGTTPESQLEKEKLMIEREKIASQERIAKDKLGVSLQASQATKAAQDNNQITKARDREQKDRHKLIDAQTEIQKTNVNAQASLQAAQIKNNKQRGDGS